MSSITNTIFFVDRTASLNDGYSDSFLPDRYFNSFETTTDIVDSQYFWTFPCFETHSIIELLLKLILIGDLFDRHTKLGFVIDTSKIGCATSVVELVYDKIIDFIE